MPATPPASRTPPPQYSAQSLTPPCIVQPVPRNMNKKTRLQYTANMKRSRKFLIFFRMGILLMLSAVSLPVFSFPFSGRSAPPSTAASAAIAEATPLRMVPRDETVEHLFTHCLIAHPEIAFAKGNEYGKHLDADCLTPLEFRRILNLLYEDGYALTDPVKTFRREGNYARRVSFPFPADKKPLILSFDDVVYASKNAGKGMADKLIVTESGEIAAYTHNALPHIHQEEFVPILEEFISRHPDFSYEHARGVIFLTGFDGILGYRTQRDSPDRETERKKAQKVVDALKAKGWKFGCHSYAHGHMNKYTEEKMRSDIEKWKNEVQPLVGETPLYAYPYGEWTLGKNCSDDRQQALINAGFLLFCGVGESPFYAPMPLGESSVKVLFQDRCAMDGISLRNHHFDRFFDAREVYDPVRPVAFPSSR